MFALCQTLCAGGTAPLRDAALSRSVPADFEAVA